MDNADGVGNGQWIIDPSVPDDVARKITSESGLKIKINPALAQKIPGTPLPEFVFQDLQHSQAMFDDMMGHHEVSRGATTSKRQTKTEVLLLKESDITPGRLLMRNNEVAITKLLNGWTQLMKLFYDQPHYIRRDLVDIGSGYILTRDEIPDNLSIMVKAGSSIPISKEARRQEYRQLFATNRLDPLSFFKLMEYPNSEKLAYRFVNWATRGILSDEPPLAPQPMLPVQEGGVPQQTIPTETQTPQ